MRDGFGKIKTNTYKNIPTTASGDEFSGWSTLNNKKYCDIPGAIAMRDGFDKIKNKDYLLAISILTEKISVSDG
jgi:hypothetical protein